MALKKWINVGRNGLRPSYLPVMLNKVSKRAEADTRAEATEWARGRATSIDDYCRTIDAALWNESMAHCKSLQIEGETKLRSLGADLGGGGAYPLLHFLVRLRQPAVVVETGVAAGWSTRAVLEALQSNGSGRLLSSDFPYFRLEHPERYVGFIVPDSLRSDWHLDVRGDRKALPSIVQLVDQIDLFHYDSDKSVGGRAFALDAVRSKLAEDALIVMDDIQDNVFFRDWVEADQLNFEVFEFGGKLIGAVGLDK